MNKIKITVATLVVALVTLSGAAAVTDSAAAGPASSMRDGGHQWCC